MELSAEGGGQMEEIANITEQLRFSKQLLQAIFDSTDSIMLLVNPDYRVIFFNKKAKDSSPLLYRRELTADANILEYTANNGDQAIRLFKSSFETAMRGEKYISEREMPFPGKSFWIRTEYAPVYDQGAIMGVAITVTDIDERKKHLLQIERQNELLKKISWMQSHHTRQPVATILGLINILDKAALGKSNREIIELLELTAQKLDDVIRDTVILANSYEGSETNSDQ
jgi:PAS domain S-box-containing protein